MKTIALAVFGWLVPGGTYLLMRRYLQFAVYGVLVSAAFAAGLAMHGGLQWPAPADLEGLDTLAALVFKGAALARLFAGGPYLLAQAFVGSHSFMDGRLHEYGTTLLVLAGLLNVLAVSGALESRKAEN